MTSRRGEVKLGSSAPTTKGRACTKKPHVPTPRDGRSSHAVQVALADVAGWGTMLGQALDETGGPLTREERAWADEILGTSSSARAVERKPTSDPEDLRRLDADADLVVV